MDRELLKTAEQLGNALKLKGLRVATAESCTTGLVCTALGAVSGSSAFFTSGFVTYSDEAKNRILGVSHNTLKRHSAVSKQAVEEMAAGAQHLAGEAVSLAISGYAGPDGGTDGTPAGTIWFGLCLPQKQLYTLILSPAQTLERFHPLTKTASQTPPKKRVLTLQQGQTGAIMFYVFKNIFTSPEKFLNAMCRDDMGEARRDRELLLFDEDGNISTNLNSPEMKASFARHVAALRDIRLFISNGAEIHRFK